MASRGSGRTRNFACVVYPDSAPDDWPDILQEQFVPAFISPLHDSDINPNGEKKKKHYHVMLMFEGVKTNEQAKEIFDKIGGVGCERVNSLRGYARYLCHLDNPEKAQYNVNHVICFCGVDYMDTIGLAIDKYVAISDILDYIEEADIVNYSRLLMMCKEQRFDWFRVLCDNGSYVVKEYIKSRTKAKRGLLD